MSKHITLSVRESDSGLLSPSVSQNRHHHSDQGREQLAAQAVDAALQPQNGEAEKLPENAVFLSADDALDIGLTPDYAALAASAGQYRPIAANGFTPLSEYSEDEFAIDTDQESAGLEPVRASEIISRTSQSSSFAPKLLGGLAGTGLLGGLAAAGGGGGGGGGKGEEKPAEKNTAEKAAAEKAAAEKVAAEKAAAEKAAAEKAATEKAATEKAAAEKAAAAAEKAAAEKAAVEKHHNDADHHNDASHNHDTSGKGYTVHMHETRGKYIDAADFGTDPTGKTDSLPAIKAALAAAHAEGASLYLHGKLYISDQIKIDQSLSNVKGLFGDGMGKTEISFDKAQTGVFNSNTNEDDIRPFAGILVDNVNGVTIADLSVKYTNPDFYRKGSSYFGKVNGIMVNDSDHTLIDGVEVTGVNRAGVFFGSTATLTKDPLGSGATYKARLIRGEIDENYGTLPLGEHNSVVNSYLHHNRVAGVLFAYQKNFTADHNRLDWNGHEADGGTGYGVAAMAGSYNYGITFTNNSTDHNYRKGLDVHDGNDIVISNNTLNGDRLYGIGVYNRQFTMDNVKITNNVITQDATFRLPVDDDLPANYHSYSGIQLQTNTQYKNLHTENNASYVINGNTIKGLTLYTYDRTDRSALQTYGIEVRNHEQTIDYTIDISNNTIEGNSSRYLIAVINSTQNPATKDKGPGSGDINITGNNLSIEEIPNGTMPIYVEEKHNNGSLRGDVDVSGNHIAIAKSNGTVEAIQMLGNAETYTVSHNKFELHGMLDKSIVSIHGRGDSASSVTISDNDLVTDRTDALYKGWIETKNVSYISIDNTHNNDAVAVSSNMSTEDVAAFTAKHEAADLAKEWAADTSLDLSSLLSADGSAQAGIIDVAAGAEHTAYAMTDTFTVDTSDTHVL